MPRSRHLDQALGTSKRSIWVATGAIVVVGAILLIWFVSPAERTRRAEVARLEIGDPVARVEGILGPPAARCEGDDLAHLAGSFPPGWPQPSIETTVQALAAATDERWIYPLDEDASATCAPVREGTEVGLDAEGRV